MKLEFIKLSPTQNMTIIVTSPVPRADHRRVAGELMDYAGVFAEQAGFLEPPTMPGVTARLQMMGGEFCGNATMSMAAYTARERGLSEGQTMTVPVEISGADKLLYCRVKCRQGRYVCSTDMPRPVGIEQRGYYSLVRLPGIAHAIVKCPSTENLRSGAEDMLRGIAAGLAEEAVGLMLYSPDKGELLPLVYVKGTDTMIWERGCGSGSAAVGALCAWETRQDACVELSQPGGIITASAMWSNGIRTLSIEGVVRIVCEGSAYV